MPPTIALSVPLYNEEEVVDVVARAYATALRETGLRWKLVLVDNGSVDRTRARMASLADEAGIACVHLDQNAGYGGGIRAGLAHALETEDPDIVGWGWGDGQVSPAVIPSLVGALERGADIAKVRRVSRRDGWRRRVVTRTYGRLHAALGGRSPDMNGCPKLMHRAIYEAAALRSEDWFLDPELMLWAEARGCRITELPAAMEPRFGGRSKVSWRTAVTLGGQVAAWHLRHRG